MITSYKDLTIKEYLELKELMAEERADDLSAQVRLVAFLDKKTEEEIMSMKLPDYHKLVEKTKFLMELPEPSKKAPKSIKIGNYKLNVVTDIAKMTTAQYIDYQNFLAMEDKEKYIANIVGCFFVPQGKKYNVGYDIDEVVDLIANNVSIQDALDICFFFYSEVVEFNKRFPAIYGMEDEEDDEEEAGDEDGTGRGDDEDSSVQDFTRRWNLLVLVDEVSELTRYNWEQVFNMDAGEFMTFASYGRDKAEYKADQVKKWQREHNGR